MKRFLSYILYALLLVFFQGAVLSTWISPGYPTPQLLIPAVILIAFNAPSLAGLLSSLCLSFLFDLFSGGPWGVWCVVGVSTFVMVSIIARQMFVKSVIVIAVLSAVATCLGEIVGACMVQGFSELSMMPALFQAMKDAVVTSAVSPLFLYIGKRFFTYKKSF